VVIRTFATSTDGTRVPLNIIRRKNTALDSSNPTLLYGYDGYGLSESPFFVGPTTRLWLDDLASSAQFLIDSKHTSPAHLAILGGSNGGLLMGAALTQDPDLYRAVISYVGIYDLLRVELDPNGAFNGTVKDPEQFKALYAYSPFHHVKDGTAYPAILFLTGENDHRVNPMESRKMTARLQAANSSDRPILLRTSSTSGHGMGTAQGTALEESIQEDADVFSFLFAQLGINFNSAGK
jgi:prolyl oligopeptidase